MCMVVDGTRYNKECCMNYGNAETVPADLGEATMECIYFGADTKWGGTGQGSGPWIAADLENGTHKGDRGVFL